MITEGSLEVKLPTVWTDGKAEVGRVREEERRRKKIREGRERERGERERESQKKEDAGAREGRTVASHCVFSNDFVAPEGRKVGSLKRRVRSHLIG